MRNNWKRKSVVALCLGVACCASLACGIGFSQAYQVSAETGAEEQTLKIDTFRMIDGASIRYTSGTTGMRYVSAIESEVYQNLYKDYDKVTFGMVILPYVYTTKVGEVNEETLFGSADKEALYCWGTAQEGKAQILMYQTESLPERTAEEIASDAVIYGDKVSETDRLFECAIANIYEYNYANSFYATSFVKLEKAMDTGTVVSYAFTDENAENIRAVAQVAQYAYNNGDAGEDTTKQEILQSFMSKTGSIYSYTVNHYIPDSTGNGEYAVETETVSEQVLNAEVEANVRTNDDYIFDSENENNVLTGKVQFDGSLALNVYYKNWKAQPDDLLQGFENATVSSGAVTNNAGTSKPVSVNKDMKYVNGGDSSLKIEYGSDTTNMHILFGSILPSRDLSAYAKLSFDIMTTKTTYVGKASLQYGSQRTSEYTSPIGSDLTANVWRTITFDLASAKTAGIDLTSCYSIYVNLGDGGTFYVDNFRVEYPEGYLQGFENMTGVPVGSITNNSGADITSSASINTNNAYVASGSQSLGYELGADNTMHLILSKLLPSNDLSAYSTLSFQIYLEAKNYVGAVSVLAGANTYSGYSSGAGTQLSAGTWHTITIDLAKLKEEHAGETLSDVYSLKIYFGETTFYIDNIIAE